MSQLPKILKESPSQTAGPYVHIGCTPNCAELQMFCGDLGANLMTGPVTGQKISITGHVYDGTGAPLLDAMIEIWQPDAAGLFPSQHESRGHADPNFTGFGRTAVDMETGAFAFETVKPGAVPWPDGRLQAPHITFWIVARGINIGLHTRMYFMDENDANADDPILTSIRPQTRMSTLMAQKTGETSYIFDIHLQGPEETVFFDM